MPASTAFSASKHVLANTRAHANVHMHVRTRARAYARARTHAHSRTHAHARMHTHTHTHAHRYSHSFLEKRAMYALTFETPPGRCTPAPKHSHARARTSTRLAHAHTRTLVCAIMHKCTARTGVCRWAGLFSAKRAQNADDAVVFVRRNRGSLCRALEGS